MDATIKPNMCSVLVVDDNIDGAESLALFISLLGHEVRVAFSGTEAFTALESFSPKIIFLDLSLPDMSGYEVAHKIRERLRDIPIKIMAVTGWDTGSLASSNSKILDDSAANEPSFDYFLAKPLDLKLIEELLS